MKRSLLLAFALVLAALALAGCGSLSLLEGKMENRITTTLACDRGFFASLWGPLGFTSEIDKKDVAHLACAGRAANGGK